MAFENFIANVDKVRISDVQHQEILEYHFEKVFKNSENWLDSLQNSLGSSIKSVIKGQNSLVILAGTSYSTNIDVLRTREGRPGFLDLVVKHIFEELSEDARRTDQILKGKSNIGKTLSNVDRNISPSTPNLAFSLIKMSAEPTEAMTDILRAASAAWSKDSLSPDPSLMLRDQGRGQGMAIAGACEVCLSNSKDMVGAFAVLASKRF